MLHFTKKVLVALTLTTLFATGGLLFWYLPNVPLLLFAGVLLAVLLNGMSDWLAGRTPLGYRLSFTAVLIFVAAIVTGIVYWIGPQIGNQAGQLLGRIPETLTQIQQQLSDTEWGRYFVRQLPSSQEISTQADNALADQMRSALPTLFELLTNAVVVLVVGIYLAIQPGLYERATKSLLPSRYRQRGSEVLAALGTGLRSWLAGRFASMAILGVLTFIGLMLLGVPLAPTLALIAAILSFVPNIGPLLSFIPAALVALTEGPMFVLYVAALYAGVQFVESYLITPLIQQRVTSVPPAFLIFWQVAMGLVFGLFGLFLATPIAVMVIILVQMLYIHDVLGKDVEILGE